MVSIQWGMARTLVGGASSGVRDFPQHSNGITAVDAPCSSSPGR
jgi:hypothetical protein